MKLSELKTGDLLLCDYTKKRGCMSYFTCVIKYFTHSNFSHITMVLKDPTFLHPSLKGLYVWESSWEGKSDPQDGKIKLGVQITPLYELISACKLDGHIAVRRVECNPELFSDTNLEKVHNVVYNKPYDIVPSDWINVVLKRDPKPQKTSRFWCSALIGYIYTKCGLLDPKTDWSNLTCEDFSLMEEKLIFINGAKLSDTIEKLC